MFTARTKTTQREMPHGRGPCALALRVRGGLNNQRECILNGLLAARTLGLALIIPSIDLVGRGNEKFEPTSPQYVEPWATNASCSSAASQCVFGTLFDEASFMTSHTMARLSDGSRIVALPPVERVAPDCAGGDRFGETCAPGPGNATLFRRLLSIWAGEVAVKAPACRADAKTLSATGASGPRAQPLPTASVVFDVGRSLCWNAFESRDVASCSTLDSACTRLVDGLLRSASVIQLLESHVMAGIEKLLHGLATSRPPHALPVTISSSSGRPSGASWAAVHLRAFDCVPPSSRSANARGNQHGGGGGGGGAFIDVATAEPSASPPAGIRPGGSHGPPSAGVLTLDGVLPGLLRAIGVPPGTLIYVVSSVPVAEVRRALDGSAYTALGKEDILDAASIGDLVRGSAVGAGVKGSATGSLRELLPFEVLAAIDFGVAARSPIYVGEPGMHSSFDAFVEAKRAATGKSAMLPISEASYCSQKRSTTSRPLRGVGSGEHLPSRAGHSTTRTTHSHLD